MRSSNRKRLLICYISGLDMRRLDRENTPFITGLFETYPWTYFANLPSNELLPTILTGVYPTEHGVWGVKLKPKADRFLKPKLMDRFPDTLTTSVQCLLHFLTSSYDLAAIPPRRRRHFEITRTKYKRRNKRPEALFRIGGFESILGIVGEKQCRYVFSSTPDPEKRLLRKLCTGGHVIELLELYSLDRYQQWNLDRPQDIRRFYSRIDQFLQKLQAKCESSGISLMIISDHGHEPIKGSIDLVSELQRLDLPESDYSYFIEVSSARLWFHSQTARRKITSRLSERQHGKLLSFEEMGEFDVPLSDPSYGEMFYFLDPGYIFFPHDFYHPLANLYLGLSDRMQRSRLRDPKHRGNHGHLPHFDTEKSFMILLEKNSKANRNQAGIIDVAPSILGVLGYEPPTTMRGHCLFSTYEAEV